MTINLNNFSFFESKELVLLHVFFSLYIDLKKSINDIPALPTSQVHQTL